ncbi:MAG: GAF domain-containing sensor histidine kinase [Caulobacteraceae bacterium]|nr:GAF domain-containing sensor histidine kinase [Caulobacteraceae bacterium]
MASTATPADDKPIARDIAAVARIAAVENILDVVCRITGMGFAAVARVTETHWIACAVRDEIGFGLPVGGELPLKTTICDEIRDSREPVVFDDAQADPAWRTHHTPQMYGLRSYISFPILRANGEMFGTLCAIDPNPHVVDTPETRSMFRLFAELIAFHLDAADSLATSEAALIDADEAAVLREQFIAVLGHDLRNPLAGIQAGLTLLKATPLNDRARTVVGQMEASATRMERLISDVLDFARGRLGGGVPLARQAEAHLTEVIEQVIQELGAAWPDRTITTEISLDRPVACDPQRVGQLLSNLLANALTHGASDGEIHVHATCEGGAFELTVTNAGEPIPDHALPHLFKPFHRPQKDEPQAGLGLGLYIASQIAQGHAGSLDAHSTPERTRFRFVMPI